MDEKTLAEIRERADPKWINALGKQDADDRRTLLRAYDSVCERLKAAEAAVDHVWRDWMFNEGGTVSHEARAKVDAIISRSLK